VDENVLQKTKEIKSTIINFWETRKFREINVFGPG